MTILNPAEIVRGQFTHDRSRTWFRSLRWYQVGLVLAATAVGVAVWMAGINTVAVGPLLTATSIITGLTFTMAMRFWERRIEINSAPLTAGYLQRKELIESLGTHLIWTVLVGVVTTAWTAFSALVSGASLAAWATGICAGLLGYQLILVAESLLKLYTSSIELG